MPLSRLFNSARRSRRSKSTHEKTWGNNNEHSGISASTTGDNVTLATRKQYLVQLVRSNSIHTVTPRTRRKSEKKRDQSRIAVEKDQLKTSPRFLRLTLSNSPPERKASSIKKHHSSIRKKLSTFDDPAQFELSADGYRLTAQQRDLLKVCWREAKQRQGDLGSFVFNWILAKYPEIIRLFGVEGWTNQPGHPFAKHVKSFNDVLELVVGSVVGDLEDNADSIPSSDLSLDDTTGPLLHAYGSRHVEFENRLNREGDLIQPEHWDIFRTAMCEYAVTTWRPNVLSAISSAVQKRNEALHAWRILVYYIVAKVRKGYELEKAELSKRSRGRSVTGVTVYKC